MFGQSVTSAWSGSSHDFTRDNTESLRHWADDSHDVPMTCTDLPVPGVERVAALATPVDGRMITFTFEKPRHERVEIAG